MQDVVQPEFSFAEWLNVGGLSLRLILLLAAFSVVLSIVAFLLRVRHRRGSLLLALVVLGSSVVIFLLGFSSHKSQLRFGQDYAEQHDLTDDRQFQAIVEAEAAVPLRAGIQFGGVAAVLAGTTMLAARRGGDIGAK